MSLSSSVSSVDRLVLFVLFTLLSSLLSVDYLGLFFTINTICYQKHFGLFSSSLDFNTWQFLYLTFYFILIYLFWNLNDVNQMIRLFIKQVWHHCKNSFSLCNTWVKNKRLKTVGYYIINMMNEPHLKLLYKANTRTSEHTSVEFYINAPNWQCCSATIKNLQLHSV